MKRREARVVALLLLDSFAELVVADDAEYLRESVFTRPEYGADADEHPLARHVNTVDELRLVVEEVGVLRGKLGEVRRSMEATSG